MRRGQYLEYSPRISRGNWRREDGDAGRGEQKTGNRRAQVFPRSYQKYPPYHHHPPDFKKRAKDSSPALLLSLASERAPLEIQGERPDPRYIRPYSHTYTRPAIRPYIHTPIQKYPPPPPYPSAEDRGPWLPEGVTEGPGGSTRHNSNYERNRVPGGCWGAQSSISQGVRGF